jgi:formylglycine-generating enzyme required for sulfatase activity
MNSTIKTILASLAALALTLSARAQEGCIADLDGDGVVNGNDLATVLVGWGPCAGCPGDVNGNGVVNGEDLASVLVRWGGTCAPTVTGISPDAGHFSGGTTVTITGTRLRSPSSVTFGGVVATVVSSTASSITVVTPVGSQGPAPVVVATAGGAAPAPTSFVYGPWVASITPAMGAIAGGASITISGVLLGGVSTVTIGGAPCASVVTVNSTTVTATTPAGAIGTATVVLTGANGAVTVPNGFMYVAAAAPAWATVLEAMPDPAIVTNPGLRNAIAATGYAWRVRDNLTQIEMVLIPAGDFNMGCTSWDAPLCAPDELPVHMVSLTSAFYMGRYEVTQAEWTAIMGSNPSEFQLPSAVVSLVEVPRRPVERVSWFGTQSFCSLTGVRLPTEAEWEYACRAGTATAFHGWPSQPNGTDEFVDVPDVAWVWAGSCESGPQCQTRPVGGKAPNGFGLYDMAGNVWEWVNDWYSASYYAASPGMNPSGPASSEFGERVLRGGSIISGDFLARSHGRNRIVPQYSYVDVGFRVARNP